MARMLFALMRADFLERTRRYSFLITLGFTLYAAYAFLPPNPSTYSTLQIGGLRGVYNSAWVGSLVAMMTTLFLSFAGFYLVKNAVARDRQTGVGQILAATSLSKMSYLLGKALSNFLVLTVMVAVVGIVAGGMQLLRGEDLHIQPLKLLTPFVLITLPMMALVSALAVFFESVNVLRGGLGNVIFFCLWMGAVSTDALNQGEFLGIHIPLSSMKEAAVSAYPDFRGHEGNMSMGFNFKSGDEQWHLKTFVWDGVEWGTSTLFGRLGWFGIALILTLFSSLFFDRFDSAQNVVSVKQPKKSRRLSRRHVEEGDPGPAQDRDLVVANQPHRTLTPLGARSSRFAFRQLLIAEMTLMLKGVSRWWMFIAAGLIVTGAAIPAELSRQFVLPFAWVWPLLIWSAMGIRETRFGTSQLIFSTARSVSRQFPLAWLSGVILTVLVGSGVGAKLFFTSDWSGLIGWIVGALFIPTFALTTGVWTGSSKLFEVLYLLLWYAGPMNKIPFLDFTGSTRSPHTVQIALVFFLITVAMFGLAIVGRRRQLVV